MVPQPRELDNHEVNAYMLQFSDDLRMAAMVGTIGADLAKAGMLKFPIASAEDLGSLYDRALETVFSGEQTLRPPAYNDIPTGLFPVQNELDLARAALLMIRIHKVTPLNHRCRPAAEE